MGDAERGCGPACVYHRDGRTAAIPLVGIASIVEGILDGLGAGGDVGDAATRARGPTGPLNFRRDVQFPAPTAHSCPAKLQTSINSLFIVP